MEKMEKEVVRVLREENPVYHQLVELIRERVSIEAAEITPEAHLIDDLGLDSLAHEELILAIESEFDFEIPDEDAQRLLTVGQLLIYLTERRVVEEGPRRPFLQVQHPILT